METSNLWAGVDRLIDRAPSIALLQRHRLNLLAARRWRELGRKLPDELLRDERRGALLALVVPFVLDPVLAAYKGPMIVFKGVEVAAHYPDPALRDFVDLDLLVPDAEAAQRALVAGGFVEFSDPELYVDIHHLRPLYWPGMELRIEIHGEPKWVDQLEPPSTQELFAAAVPSVVGIDGIGALPPAHHALILAVHSWAHEPLARLGHLVDVAAVAQAADRSEIEHLARRWGVEGIWKTTIRTADSLFTNPPARSAPLATWARHLRLVRERNVLESHLEGWISGYWGLPLRHALSQMARELSWEVRPAPGESVRNKLSRSGRALRDAFVARSEHDEKLGPDAARRRDGRSF